MQGAYRAAPKAARAEESVRSTSTGRRDRGTGARIDHWRRVVRPRVIRDVLAGTDSLRWSPLLLEVLMQELYVDDEIAQILGTAPRRLPRREYAQAVAVALVLRHSWRPDDFDYILERLGLIDAIPPSQ